MRQPDAARPRTFFPTAITTFRQCPEKYYHQYLRKRKGVQPFSRPMIIGGATHRLIASILPRYLRNGDIGPDLERKALEEISTSDYPDEERRYREQDALDVVDMTHTALDMIPTGSTSLLQERSLYAPLGRSEVQIGARVDLVLRTADGAIEHVDFKTGKVRDNTVQSLMARAVVGRRFGANSDIRTTTLFLAHRQRQTAALDRETSAPDWRTIAGNIREIRSLERFPPSPGPLCEYCPFRARECSLG